MKKSLLVLGTAIILSLSITGCGADNTQKDQQTEQQSDQKSDTMAQETDEKNEPGKDVSGVLSFLSWYEEEKFQPLLDGFHELYPDVEFDFQHVPSENSQYDQKRSLLASTDELPDIFYLGPPVQSMAENGYLADLSDLEAVKRLPQNYQDAFSYDGKVVVYSPDAWVGGVFYNVDIYEEHNLEVPGTWDEFINNCQVLLDAGVKPLAVSSNMVDWFYWLHDTEVMIDDPQFDAKINTGETTFKEGYTDALSIFYADLVEKGFITKDMVGLSDDQRMDEFSSGQAAMTITGPWAVEGIYSKNPEINMSVFPFVSADGREISSGALNVGFAVSSGTKNKAAAEAFINYVGSDEGLKIYQGITGNFLGVEGIEYEISPVMEPLRRFAESGNFALPNVNWVYGSTLTPIVEKGLQEIVLGTKTQEELIQELDDKQTELMEGR
ncbi:carbohydrate ABC transporter substrate-binding protein (CUT1 family) [Hungatella effluvii]|uniref:Carbohydrate ABC transporter substrate-binding protein (CUT1 family) n=1 Tax=Hungatella effluvii TaxID=1096246 RepID=A0A2V3Y1L6_9FIRM|nr:extracellular solute-binding protein [Hungatella effluvii]PXX52007.1 carbohydrate ABC transporter substrate-binding protein (CUT1 family) [Hungatella effluvii]